MNSWQLQHAKARFSEFLDAALKKGPQVVTRRGVEEAVLVPMEEWRRLQREKRPDIKELLLGAGPRFENIVPKRGAWKSARRSISVKLKSYCDSIPARHERRF